MVCVCFTCLSCSSAVCRWVGSRVSRNNSVIFLASMFINAQNNISIKKNAPPKICFSSQSPFSTRWTGGKKFTGRSAFIRPHTMTQAHKVSETRLHAKICVADGRLCVQGVWRIRLRATQRQCAKIELVENWWWIEMFEVRSIGRASMLGECLKWDLNSRNIWMHSNFRLDIYYLCKHILIINKCTMDNKQYWIIYD